MAKIELVDVCKTLKPERSAGLAAMLMPGMAASMAAAGLQPGPAAPTRGSPFAIRDLNLTVPDGQTMVVLGPSGCGKTTLLRIIAGLIPPESGQVRYDGVDVTSVAPGDRRIGMVFQNYALYPHLNSRTNVLSYFFFHKKTAELDALARAKYQRTSELMGVELAHLLDRKPGSLSGGERQRVALGRCITRDPALFLLDEPFSSLDQQLREKYRVNLKILLNQFRITTVYVTHDQHEALILADLLAIMDRGSIQQVGTYEEVYRRPKSIFVAEFLNLQPGTPAISLLDGRHLPGYLGGLTIGVRPEDVTVARDSVGEGVRAVVTGVTRLPMKDAALLTARVGDGEVHIRSSAAETHRVGDQVWLHFTNYHVFDPESGLRLRTQAEA